MLHVFGEVDRTDERRKASARVEDDNTIYNSKGVVSNSQFKI